MSLAHLASPRPAVRLMRVLAALVMSLGLAGSLSLTTAAPRAEATTWATAYDVMGAAKSKLGNPYEYGAEGPDRFDCSGLVQWSFAQAGIELPRTSRQQHEFAKPIRERGRRAGDLVFFHDSSGRVYSSAIYIGDNEVIHADSTKGGVVIQELWTSDVSYGRIRG